MTPTVWPSCATHLLCCLEQSGLDVIPDILSGPISYTCRCSHMQVEDLLEMIEGKFTRYKLYWSGNDNGIAWVGVFVAEEFIEKGFEVQRVSERIILVKLIVGQRAVTFLCVSISARTTSLHSVLFYRAKMVKYITLVHAIKCHCFFFLFFFNFFRFLLSPYVACYLNRALPLIVDDYKLQKSKYFLYKSKCTC